MFVCLYAGCRLDRSQSIAITPPACACTNQAEQLEREARGELYDAVAGRDDFIRHASRCVFWGFMCPSSHAHACLHSFIYMYPSTDPLSAYQEMEGRRLLELKQAMLAAARAEKAHCAARIREAEALEVRGGACLSASAHGCLLQHVRVAFARGD